MITTFVTLPSNTDNRSVLRKSSAVMNWLARFRRKTPSLGSRELSVLNLLWAQAPLSAVQVHQHFRDSGIGLNTIQSTLERLHRKQILSRSKSGRTFIYEPSLTQTELIGALIAEIEDEIAEGDMNLVISGFRTYLDETRKTQSAVQDNDADAAIRFDSPPNKAPSKHD